jgi:hypothetical protein
MDPVTAAQALLVVVCKKRKAILPKCMAFVVQILNAQQNADPCLRDGALNMVVFAYFVMQPKLNSPLIRLEHCPNC